MNKTPAVTIASTRPDGFWRCGVQHFPTPQPFEAGRFTEDELDAMRADPPLIVMEAGIAAAEPADIAAAFAAHLKKLSPKKRIGALRDMAAQAGVFDEMFPAPEPPSGDAFVGAMAAARPKLAEKDFGKNGEPDVKALERITGLDWDAGKRDASWEAMPAIAAALRAVMPVAVAAGEETA